jgi:hypothetical protein
VRSRLNPVGPLLMSLGVISLLSQTGCASAPPLTKEAREQFGTMVIVPARYIPKTNFATFAKSKPAGAAQGAAAGGGMITLTAVVSASNPYTAILLPFVAVVGTVTGGVAGAVGSLPEKNVQAIEFTLNHAVGKLDAQHALAERLTAIVRQENWIRLHSVDAAGPNDATDSPTYSALQAAGIDTVLEVAVIEIGFQDSGCGFVGPINYFFCRDKTPTTLRFFVDAKARLVRVSDGTTLFAQRFSYQSPWHEAAQWQANDGQLLAAEIESAYRNIADRINDEVILITTIDLPTPSLSLSWSDPLFGICWLAPVYPKVEHITSPLQALRPSAGDACSGLGSHEYTQSMMRFVTVDSTRPTLRWSSFPRELDRERLDPALLRKIGNVTYDLKIWEVERCERGKLAYERTGLSVSVHQLDEPLKPDHHYFWSFRARFTVDNQPMAIRWAFFDPNGCYVNYIPDWTYYRFVTPK